MFRECYFEYAGISSEPYNLILCYVSNSNEDFDSGGKFELKTDTLPRSHETLLYGKDYSAEPLTFDVEIVNHDDYIPLEQMIEIKNWLFGQDGWKILRFTGERQDYHLRCVFEPGEDIVDGTGYRGVRCTLHNISPFWYGEEKEITLTQSQLITNFNSANANTNWFGWSTFQIDIEDDGCVDCEIHPTIIVNTNCNNSSKKVGANYFRLVNTDVSTIADGIAMVDGDYVNKATSKVAYSNAYLGEVENDDYSNFYDQITISTRYLTFESERFNSNDVVPIILEPTNPSKLPPMKVFTLHQGVNICRMYYGYAYDSITFKYTPVYRLGAF